jgi:hypothetical protein
MAKGYTKTPINTAPINVSKFAQPVTNLKYIVVECEGKSALQEQIIKLMDSGYIPVGGVSSRWDKDRYGQAFVCYTQAMTKI